MSHLKRTDLATFCYRKKIFSLVIWPLTLMKRTHFSELSTSRFSTYIRLFLGTLPLIYHYSYRWMRITVIVLCLHLQSLPTHVNEVDQSGRVFCSCSFLSDSSTAQTKQIYCYHYLFDKSAKRCVCVFLLRKFSGVDSSLFQTKKFFVNESDPRSNVHYLGSSENKKWNKFKPVRDLNLGYDLRYRFSALPTELTSQLGVSHDVGSK